MKKVSVYVKGDRNSTSYYRIYQYFDNLDNCQVSYNMMYAPWLHNRYMPLSKQPFAVKAFAYIHSFCRILFFLLRDYISKPNVIVVHKRILARYTPQICKWILCIIAKHSKIIWDFDDHIVENKEVSIDTFNFFSIISSNIVVTHNFLKNLLPTEYQNKVVIMPTTDGDMYKTFAQNSLINQRRLETFDKAIELVWVATSVNLPFLEEIIPELDIAAELLYKTNNKSLILNIVCNQPLNTQCDNLEVNNIKWTHEIAIKTMFASHIGIMPLIDNEFTKGKGGFKLVQYMSAGLPCIASNVGFNSSVISNDFGRLIDNKNEWIDAILSLSDKESWVKSSEMAYSNWREKFSYQKNLNEWKRLI